MSPIERTFIPPQRNEGTRLHRVVTENLQAQAVRLEAFISLIENIFQAAAPQHDHSRRHTLLFASILKIKQSARAVQVLSEEAHVEEILAIGHTLVEITVNATWMQVAPQKEVEQYLRFHPDVLSRQIARLRDSRDQNSALQLVRKLGTIVTGSKQKTEPTWTNLSLLERAQISDQASNIPIMVPLVTRCYPRGHAAAHATVGSLNPFISAVENQQAIQPKDRRQALEDALFGINLNLFTICLYLNEFFNLGMDEAIEAASSADSSTAPFLDGTSINVGRG